MRWCTVKAMTKLIVMRSTNMPAKVDPVRPCTAHSTGRLCERRHMSERMVSWRTVSGMEVISAMGA